MKLQTERHARLWRAIEREVPRADLAHDALHLARVYRWALRLAPEAGVDPDLAGAAALVHDLIAVPKEDPERAAAGERSAEASAGPLTAAGYRPGEVAAIREAVRTSSWSRGLAPTGPLGQVLQDADRLDAIGAIGIARTLVTAQGMADRGAALRLYDPEDPLAQRRPPDDHLHAIDHFMTKLLMLADKMHLPAARDEARRRHAVMEHFLDALAREVE